MKNSSTVYVRKFCRSDREDVRRIGSETAFIGEPLGFCFDDHEILADALTLYFTDYEPGSSLVAVEENKVVGYVIGTKNAGRMQKVFKAKIMPRLVGKIILRRALVKGSARKFLLGVGVSLLRGEFSTSDLFREYPATLHVNIDREFRGGRIGTQLMERYLEFLAREGITGVHVSTMSDAAKKFFEKLGFRVLFEGKRSYLRYCLGKDLPLYVLGKKL